MRYFTRQERERLIGNYVLFAGKCRVVEQVTPQWVKVEGGHSLTHDQCFTGRERFHFFYNRILERCGQDTPISEVLSRIPDIEQSQRRLDDVIRPGKVTIVDRRTQDPFDGWDKV